MSRDRFPVAIGARRYVTDVEQISWRTVEVTRRGVDQGAGVGESSLSNEQVWRRTRESWHLGAGQEWADIPDDSSPFRFHESHGVDPFTKRQLTLGPKVEQKRAYAGTIYELLVGDGRFYIVENDTAYYADFIHTDSPTWTAITGTSGAAIGSIIVGGGYHYISENGVVSRGATNTNTVTSWYVGTAHLLGLPHGRLLASSGAELFELSAAAAKTTVFTHPDAGFRWQNAVAVPKGIIVSGYNLTEPAGSQGVFAITVDDASGALSAPFPATTLPPGEFVQEKGIAFLGGAVALITNRGFRLAIVNDDLTLTYGPLLDLNMGLNMNAVVAGGQGFYVCGKFAAHTRLSVGTSTHAGVALVRPDRFVDTLTPAWAEFMSVDINAECVAVAVDDGDVVGFSVSESGIYGEGLSTEVAPAGELATGWLTFSIPEDKQPDHVRVHTETQDADTSTALTAYSEASPSTALATATVADAATEAVGFATGDNRAERFYLRVALASENNADSPTVRRITLGASPAPFISDEIVLPLFLNDTVVDDEGAQVQLDPLDEWVFLIGLRDTQQRVNVIIGGRSYVARIAELAVVNGGLGGGNGLDGWTDKRDWPAGTWLCRLVTMED